MTQKSTEEWQLFCTKLIAPPSKCRCGESSQMINLLFSRERIYCYLRSLKKFGKKNHMTNAKKLGYFKTKEQAINMTSSFHSSSLLPMRLICKNLASFLYTTTNAPFFVLTKKKPPICLDVNLCVEREDGGTENRHFSVNNIHLGSKCKQGSKFRARVCSFSPFFSHSNIIASMSQIEDDE